tara:strand:- start:2283 stop:3782 length:1500 start_codon:yes stop_codon:yes gene_type:complete
MKIIGLAYANWCPHCTSLKPHWDTMKQNLSSDCRVIEVEESDFNKQNKIDEINHELKGDSELQIHGYPTMFKINNGKIDYYNGERDVKSMSLFFDGSKKTQKKNKTKKGKKSKKNKTKKMKGGGVSVGNKDEPHGIIKSFIKQITAPTDPQQELPTCKEIGNTTCIKPDSKSDQRINICDSQVYKGPSKGFTPFVYSADHLVNMDPQTMNLLVQTVIKKIAPNKKIEQYDSICTNDAYVYALVGKKFSSNKNKTDEEGKPKGTAISVEEYIKEINKGINVNTEYECNKIIGWLKSVFENLTFLFKEIQFHHCDPKAAQLFLDGDTVILGDLDKVTFTLKIQGNAKRMLLSRFAIGKDKVKNKVKKSFKTLAKPFKTLGKKLNFISGGSIPEDMRFEKQAYDTNDYEKTVFMASILLQLNDKLYETIVNKIKKDSVLQVYFQEYISEKKLEDNRTKKDKTGHKIASDCVRIEPYNTKLDLKSNASLVKNSDNDLVIEYNP